MDSPVGPSLTPQSVTGVTACRLEELIDTAAAELSIFAGQRTRGGGELESRGVADGLRRDEQETRFTPQAQSSPRMETLWGWDICQDRQNLGKPLATPGWRIRR